VGFQSIDLGVCRGCLWEGDPRRVVIGLPGALTVGAPSVIFCLQSIVRQGWSAIQVVDEYVDRRQDPTDWVTERATAALAKTGAAAEILVVSKSLSTRASGLVADHGYPAVWLTPLLDDEQSVAGLRRRRAPALLVGGTADPTWNPTLAYALSPDVLELRDADHGFGRRGDDPRDTLRNLERVVKSVAAFAGKLG
jgi:predicted alpha/beta-hydrolase family hydrolase